MKKDVNDVLKKNVNEDFNNRIGFNKPVSKTENENGELITPIAEIEETFGVPNENEVLPIDDKTPEAPVADAPAIIAEVSPEESPETEAPELGAQLEKFKGFKAELAIAETLDEMKFIANKAAATAEFARRNKIGLDEQNEWGKFRIEIEAKKGEWLKNNFPQGGNKKARSNSATLKTEGITKSESANARLVTDNPDLAKKVMTDIEKVGKIITPNAVTSGIKKIIKKEAKTEIEETEKTEPVLDEQQPKKRGRTSKANRIIDSEEVMALLRTAKKEVADLNKKLNTASKIWEDFEGTKWTDMNDNSISDDYKEKFNVKASKLQEVVLDLEDEIEDRYLKFAKSVIDGNIKY